MVPLLNFLKHSHLAQEQDLLPFSGHMPAYSPLNLRVDKPSTQHIRTESISQAVRAQNKVQEGSQTTSAYN